MPDPHAQLRNAVLDRVLDGPGETSPAMRRAAAQGPDDPALPPDLRQLVEKVHAHAYRVTDDEVAALQRTHGDDRLFEIVVAAALGASRHRLMAGLRALEEA